MLYSLLSVRYGGVEMTTIIVIILHNFIKALQNIVLVCIGNYYSQLLYIALFSAFEQTDCALVACNSE